MKTRYDIIIIFALAALTLAGCRQTPVEEPEGDYISFGPTAAASAQDTRSGAGSSLVEEDTELQASSFGIYGYKSNDDKKGFVNVFTTTSAQEVYYTATELTQTNTAGITWTAPAGTWTYNDRQKWERKKYYRFRAYWPYDKANINKASTAKFLAVEYKQGEDYDLMVAYATRCPAIDKTDKDPTGTRKVPMQFHHALAGLRFNFKFKDGLTNVSDVVTGFYVKGLYLSGTMIYGEANEDDKAETLRWNVGSNNFNSDDKVFSWTGTSDESDSDCRIFSVGSTSDDKTVATVFDNDKVVFAIPQTLSEYDYRPTYVYFTTKSGGDTVQSAKLWDSTNKEGIKLESGKIYTFTLVISGSSVKVNVDIEDWTETQSNIDIPF